MNKRMRRANILKNLTKALRELPSDHNTWDLHIPDRVTEIRCTDFEFEIFVLQLSQAILKFLEGKQALESGWMVNLRTAIERLSKDQTNLTTYL